MKWWRFVVAAEIRKILAFRADFWVTFLGQTLIQLLVARALWVNIFESSGKAVMEGFTLPMMTLYYLIIPIGNRMLTGENIGFLSREIYDGSFNRYLIYPLSFFQYKTLTYLTYSAFYGLQMILVFLLYKIFLTDGITIADFLHLSLGVVFFLFASFAYGMLAMFVELISLWADNVWSLMVMVRFICFFFGGSFVPLVFFPVPMQKVLQYSPFPYLISLPARVTMGIATGTEMFTGVIFLIIWAIIFRQCAKVLWNKGQHNYTGVGI
jgi:ABC-2 type transport system permease protein